MWETRNRRRLNHLYLDHIALTPDPAYETANVLAVRAQDPDAVAEATPNLERLRIRELQELYASIDNRYLSG